MVIRFQSVIKAFILLGIASTYPMNPEETEGAEKRARLGSYSNSDSALIEAAQQGDVELARLALNAGANINTRSASGLTALLQAVWFGYLELVKFLLEELAKRNLTPKARSNIINTTTPSLRHTALHFIIKRVEPTLGAWGEEKDKNSLLAITRSLLEQGADPNVCSSAGVTPLGIALQAISCVYYDQRYVQLFAPFIELLIRYGTRVDESYPLEAIAQVIVDPLEQAVVLENVNVVKEKLALKRQSDAVNFINHTSRALTYAATQPRHEIIRLLLDYNALPFEAIQVIENVLLTRHSSPSKDSEHQMLYKGVLNLLEERQHALEKAIMQRVATPEQQRASYLGIIPIELRQEIYKFFSSIHG
jgi:ankyrin repeat protein